jgi:hypothetical protein
MSFRAARSVLFVMVIVAFVAAGSTAVHAQCSGHEMVSVVVLDNVEMPDPERDLWLVERVHIAPLGPITNPTDPEIVAAIQAATGTDCLQELRETVGDFRLYWGCAWDFITTSIVDTRTGEVPFAGWVHWAGLGDIIVPDSSTHALKVDPRPISRPPAEVSTIPNSLWEFPNGTAEAVVFLSFSDLFHSYADCGPYTVTGYTYTPRVGYPKEDVRAAAKLVIIVRGELGPPWVPVSVESESWGQVKALYRE